MIPTTFRSKFFYVDYNRGWRGCIIERCFYQPRTFHIICVISMSFTNPSTTSLQPGFHKRKMCSVTRIFLYDIWLKKYDWWSYFDTRVQFLPDFSIAILATGSIPAFPAHAYPVDAIAIHTIWHGISGTRTSATISIVTANHSTIYTVYLIEFQK